MAERKPTGAAPDHGSWIDRMVSGYHLRLPGAPLRPKAFPGTILLATITCPACGHTEREMMPTDSGQSLYECRGCQTILRPAAGKCCVFCAYGDRPCPPRQAEARR